MTALPIISLLQTHSPRKHEPIRYQRRRCQHHGHDVRDCVASPVTHSSWPTRQPKHYHWSHCPHIYPEYRQNQQCRYDDKLLGWTTINRIHYKIATITCRALHLQKPSNISSLLLNYIPPRTLRSASRGLLNTPGSPTVVGARRFSSAATVIWNKLPYTVWSAETIETFRTRLKTCLFPVIGS